MTVSLVTYADQTMSCAQRLCESSARKHGIESVWSWPRPELEATEFYRDNKQLLDQPKGAGYFAWKPFVILDTLERRCKPGDILIYSDSGVEFIDNTRYIIDRMDQDVFLFGNMWEHAHWCKADTVREIWPTPSTYMGDPSAWWRFGKQCQASVIFFRVSDFSRKFVKEWLEWCVFENGRLCDDSPSGTPNHPEFQEHRWDQAILTTLTYREGIKLHWWPAVYNRFTPGGPVFTYEKSPEFAGDSYPVLFHHHRLRDHEWKSAA